MPERFALYFAPPPTSPLWRRAAQWLGRDPAGGTVRAVDISGIDTKRRLQASESARRYGFHATIKAPMKLAGGFGRADLERALQAFAQRFVAITIGRLMLAPIDGFIALIPERQPQSVTDFAGEVVIGFDRFRAPLADADRETRIQTGKLTPRQIELLTVYGYPYVLEEFQFHMTLADRLPDGERETVLEAARGWFGEVLADEIVLDRLTLFHEAAPGAPFMRLADFPLRTAADVDA